MKKKHLFLAALALTALVGCTEESFVGDQSLLRGGPNGDGAISFNMNTPAITRATQEDATAATTLGNRFIVWGEKNESGKTAATAANIVFQNYTVVYGASSAHTTASNTDDWEYVGQTSYTTKLTPNAPATQTIKYWDNAASSYTFTAVSALDGDITGDKVVITKNTSGSSDEYDKGYTIAVKDGATASKIFFADRIHNTPANLNSNAVKFTFRNLQAKLRFGIYETVPGYSVSIDKVYYNSTNSTTNFGVDGKFIKPATNTSFTVTYGNGTTGTLNKAIVAVTADAFDTYKASTSTTIMSATSIGTASSSATMDDYVSILPYISNTTDLSFTIDYTLKSEDTGETIAKTGKAVKVPAAYCKWQSNYAYTYLFKITDSDLTPITFDACYVEDENGNQETITTVETPSITTYSKASAVTSNNEYKKNNNIYVVVDNAGTLPTLTADNAKLYLVTNDASGGKALQEITEESVANALAHGTTSGEPVNTWTVTGVNMEPLAVTTVSVPSLTPASSIPAADSPTGVAIALDGTNNKCAYFKPTAAGTYVFEYNDNTNKHYKVIKVVD